MATEWPDASIFDDFAIFEETYKNVQSNEIKAAVLIPKDLNPGSHPVIVNVHGGFLMTAHSLFAPFFSTWAISLALRNSAVIVSPDYRLLPTTNGVADVLEDLEDFWEWTRIKLPEVLERRASGHSVDFFRLLLIGSSAGGYGAMQLALSHPNDVSAIAMAYPFLDPKDDIFVKGPTADEPTLLRFPWEDIPSKDAITAWLEDKKKTVETKAGFERTPFCVGAAQHGLFHSEVFDNRNLGSPQFYPIERIKAGAKLPKKIWLLHGDDDSVVYIRSSQGFVNLVREKLPDVIIRFDIASGQDHAFDLQKPDWESFAVGSLDFVKVSWLGK